MATRSVESSSTCTVAASVRLPGTIGASVVVGATVLMLIAIAHQSLRSARARGEDQAAPPEPEQEEAA